MPGQVTEPNLSTTYPLPPLPLSLLPNDILLPPSVPQAHSFDTDTQRDGYTTLIQEHVNQVNYNGLATHPVIITAPFGIWFNPIQQHGQEFEQNILFNASIIHIDPQHNILAIRAGHMVLTFISNAIEPVLTSNSPHPNKNIATSKPSSTQPDPDDDHNLLYLTPPPSPASLSRDQHEGEDHNLGMLNEQLHKQSDQVNATSALVDDQINQSYPAPPPSPTKNHDTNSDHNIYLTTTYWPSDQRRQLPTRSWHARTDKELLSDESGMDVDAYSDDSYDYSRSIPTNHEEKLTQYPTDIATHADSPSTPSINDLPTQVDDQTSLFSESSMQDNEYDNYNLRYPTPPSSTPVEHLYYETNYDHESTKIEDTNDIYYSTTHWPSNHLTLSLICHRYPIHM
jgi:hypothetical protein